LGAFSSTSVVIEVEFVEVLLEEPELKLEEEVLADPHAVKKTKKEKIPILSFL
jgi:hypothetical protein